MYLNFGQKLKTFSLKNTTTVGTNLIVGELGGAAELRRSLDDERFSAKHDRDDDVAAEREDAVVRHVARLAERLLQLLLDRCG